MNEIPINTSQNVNINFVTAGIGERFLAWIIDFVIMIVYSIAIMLIAEKVFFLESLSRNWDDFSLMALWVILFLPVVFYTLFFESIMQGQTPGKKLLKIRVVKIDGYQARFSDYLVNWILRLIDIWFFWGLVGGILIIASKFNQRLGDMASGTAVISLKSKINISHTILENLKEDYIARFPQVVALSDNDMRIIKDNYIKSIKSSDRNTMSRLAEKIRQTTNITYDQTQITDRQFIDIVIKDYNFYTGKD